MDMSLRSPLAEGNGYFCAPLLRSARARSPVRAAAASILRFAGEACRGLASGMMSAAAQLGDADGDASPKSTSTSRRAPPASATDACEPAPPSSGLLVDEPVLEPKFAFRADGSVLLLVDDFVKTLDLAERRPLAFVLLRPSEVSFVQARLLQGEHEMAARLAGKLRKRSS